MDIRRPFINNREFLQTEPHMKAELALLRNHKEINDIAIIYCKSPAYSAAREIERLADEEIIEVAQAVKSGLELHGYSVDLVDLDAENIVKLSRYDWIFNLVETVNGFPLTDSEVTQKLEYLGIPFTGSSSKTLKACLDKATAKKILIQHHINTPEYFVCEPGCVIEDPINYPVIIKPVHEDGCVGITGDSHVNSYESLITQVKRIHRIYQQAALVEEFIDGRDITASILGNGENVVVLPLSEIIYSSNTGYRHLTFNANWVIGSIDYQDSNSICPSNLNLDLENRIKAIALESYHVMGCRDYARVDFRLQNDEPHVLEVNPNPCINPDGSGFIKAALAAGISYSDLVAKILELSIKDRQISIENTMVSVLS
jgi:D-alanine-D-alanine ligase